MSDPAPIALEGKGIVKDYLSSQKPLRVLDGIDLALPRGRFVSIMGASGSGKSTLLHILGGLDWPTQGSVTVAGENITALGEGPLAVIRNRHIGYIFQHHNLLVEFTALENVSIPWSIYHHDAREASARAEQLLRETGVWERRHHRIGELSGGEMQRVAIARALITEPTVVLADEPTGNLDEVNSMKIVELLRDLCGRRQTAVAMVTHAKALAERCDERWHLAGGKIHLD